MSYWSSVEHTFEEGTGTRDHTTGSKGFIIQVDNMHLNPPPDFTLRAVGTFLGSKGLTRCAAIQGGRRARNVLVLFWWPGGTKART